MKTSNLKYLYIVIAIAIVSAGCKKIVESYSGPNDVKTLLEDLKYEPQVFTVTAGTNQTIIGARGTRIHFTPISFKNSGGSYITTGAVEVKLIETPKAKDMLLNSVSTLTTSGDLLQSGGSVNIKAAQNGQQVFPGQYSIDFKQDTASADSMQLFTQNEPNNIVTWNPISGQNAPIVGTSMDSGAYYYGLSIANSFNWINCDYFYNDPSPKTDVLINISGANFNLGELMVFIVLEDINANIYMRYLNQNDATKLHLGAGYELPIGMKAHFIVLGMNSNKVYYGVLKNQTISNNLSKQITVSESSVSQIKAAIDAL